MGEQDDTERLGDKDSNPRAVSSGDRERNSTPDIGLTPRDHTVRARIVVTQGRRREVLKKRRPSSAT